jgi:hypothetical protein
MDYRYLSGIVGPLRPGGHEQAAAVTRAAITDWAIDALRGIADGRRPLHAVRHPLGFTCLPVERAGLDGVCVHLWNPLIDQAALTTSPVHAHCWELTSYALFGRLENRVMEVGDARDGAVSWASLADGRGLYRVLDVRSRKEMDELVPTVRFVHCWPGQRQAVRAGDVYSVPAGVFHATDVSAGTGAATVALGRLVPGAPDCLLGPPEANRHEVRRRLCDADQTSVIARAALDLLTGPGPLPRERPADQLEYFGHPLGRRGD